MQNQSHPEAATASAIAGDADANIIPNAALSLIALFSEMLVRSGQLVTALLFPELLARILIKTFKFPY
jgi:hypothetical protein